MADPGGRSIDRKRSDQEAAVEYGNLNAGVSSFLILAPMAFRFTSYNNLHKTNEFLDFTIKVRAQKCILERLAVDNGDVLPEKKDKKNKK